MTLRLLTEHNLEFLSLKGGCTGWSESAPVKMPHYCMALFHSRRDVFIKMSNNDDNIVLFFIIRKQRRHWNLFYSKGN